ncbi:MAG TPA: four helix bundle protein [Saprospirales bacterium]|nr:four helix bundle protein [Saprospirales bacterium]HRQ29212.1 four helix bundle protein [Saprospiraceae bacterium]
MSHIFSFEKLKVWQDARVLVNKVYETTKNYPENERFGLTNQMRRAVLSVCSNIAEGSSRTSPKDQADFYQMAFSSLNELLNQIIISQDLNYLNVNEGFLCRVKIEKISNKINALRKSTLIKID